MIRVVLSGATGKVGRALLPAIDAADDLQLAAAAAPSLGLDLRSALAGAPADVVVDFTAPEFAAEACRLCTAAGVPLVLGTTGIGEEALHRLGEDAAAAGVPLFHAANFAIGAVLMMRFAEEASRHMPAAEIVELHADTKRDAPSGTSRATAARMQGDVPIHSVRLPGLVAHQEVILGGAGETLTIRHDTTSREAFAPGVLLAVRTVRDLPPGLTVGLEILLARSA
jgi:4-hydroxy-tetrahydrodipicolinate reductase